MSVTLMPVAVISVGPCRQATVRVGDKTVELRNDMTQAEYEAAEREVGCLLRTWTGEQIVEVAKEERDAGR